jgi:hypothetical protein
MNDGIYKTNVAKTSPMTIPLSNPKEKFGDIFKVVDPMLSNGLTPVSGAQYNDDEPENKIYIQSYDGIRLDLEWSLYSPRNKNVIKDNDAIANNPFIENVSVSKRRCSLSEVQNPNKSIGSVAQTFSGINGGRLSIDLEENIDRYLNLDIKIEDIFGNNHTGNLILRNDPAELSITDMYTSGGFAHFNYTGSSDLKGLNLYGFTGSNIYGKIEDNENFKNLHKVKTINEGGYAKIPMYPKKRFYILASPFDSAGESDSVSLIEGSSVEQPSGLFFVPSYSGLQLIKKYGGSSYEVQYKYDWVDNPFVSIKYRAIPTGEIRNAVSGYEDLILYDYAYLNDEIATDSNDSTKFIFDNLMSWQNSTNTGEKVQDGLGSYGSNAGSTWSSPGPRYSGENGIYKYAYIDTSTSKITCVSMDEISSGLCPVQGTFSMPINEPNSDEINFRQGVKFNKRYEKASTYLKEIKEMPAVILNKTQLNKVKQFTGVKGWIGLRRQDVGCLDSLFSTNIQNEMFFKEVDFDKSEDVSGYLDKDGDNRYFLKNNVGENWSWVNSSGDHIYKYAGNSGYENMDSQITLQAEYIDGNETSISEDTQRVSFNRPKLINISKSEASEGISIRYELEGSSFSGNNNHPEIIRLDFHTGDTSSYTPSDDNIFQTISGFDPPTIEAIQHSANINSESVSLKNIVIVSYDNLGSGFNQNLEDEVGHISLYAQQQIIEESLDENYTNNTDNISVSFPIKTKSPKITFAVSTKNTIDPPTFINAMMVGEPEEDSAQFLLSQPPPSTGYCLTLSILAGNDSDY